MQLEISKMIVPMSGLSYSQLEYKNGRYFYLEKPIRYVFMVGWVTWMSSNGTVFDVDDRSGEVYRARREQRGPNFESQFVELHCELVHSAQLPALKVIYFKKHLQIPIEDELKLYYEALQIKKVLSNNKSVVIEPRFPSFALPTGDTLPTQEEVPADHADFRARTFLSLSRDNSILQTDPRFMMVLRDNRGEFIRTG